MKVYVVGGAVRDELLGLPVQDRDYVVVGATPEDMVRQGFRPVGKDFPVFLHPQTHEEYALARTERKSGRGYKGFTVYAAPDVTLEDDLRRRDLTINAMAKGEDGTLVDPFRGREDLERRLLRHVSEAFAEDPVRLLRVARFAARFGFRVADETRELMKAMVRSGEADFLVPERVWQEFAKGLAEREPARMVQVLEDCGLWQRLLPPAPDRPALERAAAAQASVAVRFALLAWPLEEAAATKLCERLKAPNEVRELAALAARTRPQLRRLGEAQPAELLELLKQGDAFRRPERFAELLQTAGLAEPAIEVARAERARAAAAAVNAGEIAARAPSPADIPRLVDEARIQAIAGQA